MAPVSTSKLTSSNLIPTLLSAGLSESASLLAEHLYYTYQHEHHVPQYVIKQLADAYQGDNQHRRALQFYKRLSEQYSVQQLDFDGSDHESTYKLQPATLPALLQVQLDILHSYLALHDYKQVIHIWQQILHNPAPLLQHLADLPVRTLLQIGRICQQNSVLYRTEAEIAYQTILSVQPYAIEVYIALLQLQHLAPAALKQHSSGVRVKASADDSELQSIVQFMQQYVDALGMVYEYKHQAGIEALTAISARYQHRHPTVLCQLAYAHSQISDYTIPLQLYERCIAIDAMQMAGMGRYALLLYKRGYREPLLQLTTNLLAIDENRPEGWIAAALLYAHGDAMTAANPVTAAAHAAKAQQYVKRALALDGRDPSALLAQSVVSMIGNDQQPPDIVTAVHVCKQVLQTYPYDMSSYQLLIQANLECNEIRTAWQLAHQALELNKKNSKFLTLAASVLMHSASLTRAANMTSNSDSLDKAEKLLQRALQFDRHYMDAKLGLVELLVQRKEFDKAINTLHQMLSPVQDAMQPSDPSLTLHGLLLRPALVQPEVVHVKLGSAHASNGGIDQALHHLQSALQLAPDYTVASRALAALELELKGGAGVTDEDARQQQQQADDDADGSAMYNT